MCAVLFLELAILMNITKWVCYFLFLRTHRKIRWEELYVQIIDCKVEDDYNLPSNQLKLENFRKNFLSKLDRQTCITYSIVGTIAVGIIVTYMFFTVKLCLNFDDRDNMKEIEAQLLWVNVVGLALLIIGPTVVNMVMIHKLRDQFDDLYADYGC